MILFLFADSMLFLKAYPLFLISAYCNAVQEGIHLARPPCGVIRMSLILHNTMAENMPLMWLDSQYCSDHSPHPLSAAPGTGFDRNPGRVHATGDRHMGPRLVNGSQVFDVTATMGGKRVWQTVCPLKPSKVC
jgi:hypothetical protein